MSDSELLEKALRLISKIYESDACSFGGDDDLLCEADALWAVAKDRGLD